ncbi:hypothetical protein D9M68_644730 [compost metagenome]
MVARAHTCHVSATFQDDTGSFVAQYEWIFRSLALTIDEAHVRMANTRCSHLHENIGRAKRLQPHRLDRNPPQLPESHRCTNFANHCLDTRMELIRSSTSVPCSSMAGGPLRGVMCRSSKLAG